MSAIALKNMTCENLSEEHGSRMPRFSAKCFVCIYMFFEMLSFHICQSVVAHMRDAAIKKMVDNKTNIFVFVIN